MYVNQFFNNALCTHASRNALTAILYAIMN